MPAVDQFSALKPSLSDPCSTGAAVTPHDTSELTDITRMIYVGGAGTLTVVTAAGDTLAFGAVTAGSLLPLRVKIIKATGTSATNIVALW